MAVRDPRGHIYHMTMTTKEKRKNCDKNCSNHPKSCIVIILCNFPLTNLFHSLWNNTEIEDLCVGGRGGGNNDASFYLVATWCFW